MYLAAALAVLAAGAYVLNGSHILKVRGWAHAILS
jgi:hypothetical protein